MLTLPFGIPFAHHPGDTDDVKAEKAAIFLVAVSCCFAGLGWSGMYLLAFGPGVTAGLPFLFVIIVGSSLVVAHLRQNHVLAIYAQIASIIYITTLIQWSIGDVFSSGFVMAWALMGPLIALMFFSIRNAIIWQVLFIFNILITVLFNDFFTANGEVVTRNWQHLFFVMNLCMASTVVFAFSAYFVTNALNEKRKADNLLLNILPGKIARTLKSRSGVIADEHPNVSVLFADIVDYTVFAGNKKPAEVVSTLNDIFTRFDVLIERHGLEKIKTIGDSYMLAGGLTELDDRQAYAVADVALEMLNAVKDVEAGDGGYFSLRIGIDCGPVVAGVIGHQKFAYDLWGDTVNIASRLEASSRAGHIHVSRRFQDKVEDEFEFESCGKVTLKGKGELETFFLIGRKSTTDLRQNGAGLV